MDTFKSPKFILALLGVLAITAVVIIALVTKAQQQFPNQMSVTGQGKVFAKPDVAVVRLGVKTEARLTAAQAVAENTKKMNNVTDKLKSSGIELKDIKTASYTLSPEYDYIAGRQRLRGYTLNQEIQVKVRNTDLIGKVIEATISAGANVVGDVSFIIDDPEVIKAQAREEAIIKAKEKAKSLQELTGIKLGELMNVYESEFTPPPIYGYGGVGGGGEMAKGTPSLQPGENEITLDVTLVYEVED